MVCFVRRRSEDCRDFFPLPTMTGIAEEASLLMLLSTNDAGRSASFMPSRRSPTTAGDTCVLNVKRKIFGYKFPRLLSIAIQAPSFVYCQKCERSPEQSALRNSGSPYLWRSP